MSRETDACRRYVDTIPGDRFDIAIRGARAVGREAVNCVRIGDVKGSSFCARRAAGFYFAAIEIVKLWVITIVLLWKATLLSGSFQVVEDGGVQPLM